MKRNTSCLPSVHTDELAGVAGGVNRVATASGSIDPNTLELMFSQLQSSVQNISNAQNSGGNLLPLAAMAFALRGNEAPVAQQPLVISIPSGGGGWHHHRRRC